MKKPSSFSHYRTSASCRQGASGTQLPHITQGSPWLQATAYCVKRTTAAPGVN